MKQLIGILAVAALLTTGVQPASAAITPGNVSQLQQKWDFPTGTVSASPVVANGLVYAGAWNGTMYALDQDDGSVVWSFNVGPSTLGIQSTVLVTPNLNGDPAPDVCFGDSNAHVWCRDGLDGSAIWDKSVVATSNCTMDASILCTDDSECTGVGTCAGTDHIWSGLHAANGRLFVSVASHSDVPCTRGRLVALDLATGADLWDLQTVPDMICDTDTSIECTDDSECPAGGTCVNAKGAGVTATVSTDPTGSAVYMNTVGCYTFPSVGDSDSMFKIDAATGAVDWKTRVDAPEQFGSCSNDASIDCGTDADCGASNTCNTKANYHDFGFLNGPTPVEVPDGMGTKTILVSGSKNGTLYALNETNGTIAWTNAVQPKPISPGFAGFGLFNGPVAVADGRVHAALYQLIPARVCDNDNAQGCTDDTDCPGGTCPPAPEHFQAFDVTDGSVLWTDEIGTSWSGVGAANGVAYTGTQQANEFYAYNAATGARLATFPLPANTTSKATVDGDSLYIGYGVFAAGGVRAYELAPPPVPALSTWMSLLLAAVLAMSAGLVLRRRARAWAPARSRRR